MLLIPCPYCGPRDSTEFTYGGDATVAMPDLSADFLDGWYEYIYLRENPRGPHREYWLHSGCRAWLVVERDTLTHEIGSVQAARPLPATTAEAAQ